MLNICFKTFQLMESGETDGDTKAGPCPKDLVDKSDCKVKDGQKTDQQKLTKRAHRRQDEDVRRGGATKVPEGGAVRPAKLSCRS